jgi:hypothetical protein
MWVSTQWWLVHSGAANLTQIRHVSARTFWKPDPLTTICAPVPKRPAQSVCEEAREFTDVHKAKVRTGRGDLNFVIFVIHGFRFLFFCDDSFCRTSRPCLSLGHFSLLTSHFSPVTLAAAMPRCDLLCKNPSLLWALFRNGIKFTSIYGSLQRSRKPEATTKTLCQGATD